MVSMWEKVGNQTPQNFCADGGVKKRKVEIGAFKRVSAPNSGLLETITSPDQHYVHWRIYSQR